jgi:hypothetical protein
MKVRRYGYRLAAMLAIIALGTSTVFAQEKDTKEEGNIQEEDLVINSDETKDGDSVLLSRQKLIDVDRGKSGKITVRLTEGKEGVSGAGVRFGCVKVADIVNGKYVLEEMYQDSGVDLNHIENSMELEEAALDLVGFVEAAEVEEKETDQDGEVVFSKLETGVYVVRAEENLAYDEVCPALISVPLWDANRGEMCYETVLEPKHIPRPDEPGLEDEPEIGDRIREAPQTGVKDNTVDYLIAAASCFFSVCLFVAYDRISKRGKKK